MFDSVVRIISALLSLRLNTHHSGQWACQNLFLASSDQMWKSKSTHSAMAGIQDGELNTHTE